jgi:hypothetical protein
MVDVINPALYSILEALGSLERETLADFVHSGIW